MRVAGTASARVACHLSRSGQALDAVLAGGHRHAAALAKPPRASLIGVWVGARCGWLVTCHESGGSHRYRANRCVGQTQQVLASRPNWKIGLTIPSPGRSKPTSFVCGWVNTCVISQSSRTNTDRYTCSYIHMCMVHTYTYVVTSIYKSIHYN
jgi:hypothetical protein